MDVLELRAVQDNMADLTKVRVNDVIDYVMEEDLLSLSNMEEVSAKPTDTEKMRHLVYLVSRCPRRGAFSGLVRVLRQAEYPWLADRLEDRITEHRLRREKPAQHTDHGGDRDSGMYEEDQDDSLDGDNSHSPVSPSDSPIFCQNAEEIVYIQHDSARLGIRVQADQKYGRQGFLVTELSPHGFGESTGALRPDDLIYSIGDTPCDRLTLGAFMDLLRPTTPEGVEVKLGRVRPRLCWMEKRPVRLRRKGSAPFGFSLASGVDRPRFEGDCGVYVNVVVPGSAAHRAGLRARDGLVVVSRSAVVDGVPVEEMEALLQAAGADVCLTVERRNSLASDRAIL